MRMVTATNLTDATGPCGTLLQAMTMNEKDQDRLELLDRIAKRVPELNLDQHEIEWTTLPDGHEALAVDGGGFDGGGGTFFANAGEDLHAVGLMGASAPGHVGCVVIKPDGSRKLGGVVPDPLAQ
jgi:hypothetical protein